MNNLRTRLILAIDALRIDAGYQSLEEIAQEFFNRDEYDLMNFILNLSDQNLRTFERCSNDFKCLCTVRDLIELGLGI